jgi:hypothetical protein
MTMHEAGHKEPRHIHKELVLWSMFSTGDATCAREMLSNVISSLNSLAQATMASLGSDRPLRICHDSHAVTRQHVKTSRERIAMGTQKDRTAAKRPSEQSSKRTSSSSASRSLALFSLASPSWWLRMSFAISCTCPGHEYIQQRVSNGAAYTWESREKNKSGSSKLSPSPAGTPPCPCAAAAGSAGFLRVSRISASGTAGAATGKKAGSERTVNCAHGLSPH